MTQTISYINHEVVTCVMSEFCLLDQIHWLCCTKNGCMWIWGDYTHVRAFFWANLTLALLGLPTTFMFPQLRTCLVLCMSLQLQIVTDDRRFASVINECDDYTIRVEVNDPLSSKAYWVRILNKKHSNFSNCHLPNYFWVIFLLITRP